MRQQFRGSRARMPLKIITLTISSKRNPHLQIVDLKSRNYREFFLTSKCRARAFKIWIKRKNKLSNFLSRKRMVRVFVRVGCRKQQKAASSFLGKHQQGIYFVRCNANGLGLGQIFQGPTLNIMTTEPSLRTIGGKRCTSLFNSI